MKTLIREGFKINKKKLIEFSIKGPTHPPLIEKKLKDTFFWAF